MDQSQVCVGENLKKGEMFSCLNHVNKSISLPEKCVVIEIPKRVMKESPQLLLVSDRPGRQRFVYHSAKERQLHQGLADTFYIGVLIIN